MPTLLARASTRYRCEPCGVTVMLFGDPLSVWRDRYRLEEAHRWCPPRHEALA